MENLNTNGELSDVARIQINPQHASFVEHELKKPTKFIFFKEHDVKLTENAVRKIRELKIGNPNNIIRVMISGGGCQGFQYEFLTDLVENIGKKTRDVVLYDENKILLLSFDLFSEFYVKGAKINYVSTLLESGFKIESNPQSKSSCGCKKSFASDAEFEGEDD